MAYTTTNFRTKKALKDAFGLGTKISVFQPNDMFGDGTVRDGTAFLEGPHYPEPHRWYAQVEVKDGIIIKIVK
jgi:hypothetical protein